MQIINTVAALRERLSSEASISFVPTMGNLHAGHIQLIKLAKEHGQCVVVSIFVNPLQFGANEDLASYPRTLEADCEKLKAAGANVVFTPEVSEMYPSFDAHTQSLGQTMTINPPPIADALCGEVRPGHFNGVATIVLKLFNIVFFNTKKPNTAVFGKKDFQQLFIIRELVRQFNLPISIIAVETMREADGLAMSSRNGYLDATQRAEAVELHKTLTQIVNSLQKNKCNKTDFTAAEKAAKVSLSARGWVVDYISIREAMTLSPAKPSDTSLVVLGAARLGKTRLIDNIEFLLH